MTPVTFEAAEKHPIMIPPLELASFSSLSRHSRSICPVNGFSSRLTTQTSTPTPSRFLQGKRFEWCSWGEASTVTWRPLSIHSKDNYFSLGFTRDGYFSVWGRIIKDVRSLGAKYGQDFLRTSLMDGCCSFFLHFPRVIIYGKKILAPK